MDERRRSQVAALVEPKSVALLGASSDSRILGGRPLAILGQHDWTGPIYPVHPTKDEIGGLPAFRSIAEVPGPVDLAVFLVPPPVVPELLDQCGAAGVTTSYIITSGFGEAPEGDGRRLDTALREACARWPGMGVAGPNGEGVFDVAGDFALSFSPTVDYERGLTQRPVPGSIAVVAQSGGIGFGIFNQGTARGLRFSKVVSTGNEVDLEALDYVEYLLEDPATSVIALFIEGFKNPGRLRPVARRALEAGKPIVIMKVGRSVQAQRTAVSHTGHLTGRSDLYSALFADFGITEVRSMDELLDVAGALVTTGPVAGRRVGVFTASGGAGLWVVDACAEHGLDVPELPAAEQAGILARLPYYASASNPVDYTAGASDEHGVTAALAGLAGSSSVDVVVLVMSLTVAAGLAERVRPLVELVAAAGKPLVVQSYTHPVPEAVAVLADFKVPWFVNQQGLGRTLAALADRHDAEQRGAGPAAAPAPDDRRPSSGTAERVVPEHAVKACCGAPGSRSPTGAWSAPRPRPWRPGPSSATRWW